MPGGNSNPLGRGCSTTSPSISLCASAGGSRSVKILRNLKEAPKAIASRRPKRAPLKLCELSSTRSEASTLAGCREGRRLHDHSLLRCHLMASGARVAISTELHAHLASFFAPQAPSAQLIVREAGFTEREVEPHIAFNASKRDSCVQRR